ncbi:hypothetical protein CAEBREN_15011 [Caenorhabditis brenneri]|uniref:Uncharacterized protein n=1 Tax=Caenorhabditis brenneri TaxID=135651 RepID=G0NIS3_CAEBE|nr:hypothetical protein CAEBREN_15011 [Caenorhabditis brenneri]
MSSIETLKSEYDNASSIDKTKTDEQSEGKKSKKEKPSPTTATEKTKSQKAARSKKPKHELTDSQYERFIEYEKTRNAEKTKKQYNFKMEVTPKIMSIDPNTRLKVTVKCMAGCSQNVLVDVDSFFFEILGSKQRDGRKTQISREMEHEDVLEFLIGLRNEKDAPVPSYGSVGDLKGYLTICRKPYRSHFNDVPQIERYTQNKEIRAIKAFGTVFEDGGFKRWPIHLTKETDQVKRMITSNTEKIAEYDRKEEVENQEKKRYRNNFQMDVNPKYMLSIDPEVPFKVSVKSLAKEKQKLIVEVDSFFFKLINRMSQREFATQIYCTIMPQETLNFEIGLKTEEEARFYCNVAFNLTFSQRKSNEEVTWVNYFNQERLTIYNIKFEAEDENISHWTPYKPNLQQTKSTFLYMNMEISHREHGYAEWKIGLMNKQTEATIVLKGEFRELQECKEPKKKKNHFQMSSIEKLKSEYDNASSIDKTKTDEQSEGKKSKKEKPSPTTATEKPKSQKAAKSKKPKHELTDSQYERFIEYEKTRNTEKTKKQDNFKIEVTPSQISIDPNTPLKVTVKCMAGCSQEVLVEVDSFLFEILKPEERQDQKTQIFKRMEHEETLEFEIRLRSEKEAPVPNYASAKTPEGYLTIGRHPYRYLIHDKWSRPRSNSYGCMRRGRRRRRFESDDIRGFSRLPEGSALQKWSIQLTKETDQVKRMITSYTDKNVEYDRKKEVEMNLARNNFQMDVNPKNMLSIDPDVPFKVSVKSLAKEKQKLIVQVDSFFLKIVNRMSQDDLATQIYCTIMPQETINFEIGLKNEEEARKSKENVRWVDDEQRLIIYNIKFEVEDEKKPHWAPYKPIVPQIDSIFVRGNDEMDNKEHGYAQWRIELMNKETEATKMLSKVYHERKEDKDTKKKKKCVIQ